HITRGRGFTEQEEQANAPVAVISESPARRFWPNENPLGKHIGVGVAAQQGGAATTSNFPLYEIIGLTNDTRQSVVWRPDETFLYLPLPAAQANTRSAGDNLIVSAVGDVRAVMRAAYKEAAALDPNLFALLSLVDDSLPPHIIPFHHI